MHLNTPVDRLIRHFRLKPVLPYFAANMAVCDIGCGENPMLLKALENDMEKLVGIDRLVKTGVAGKIELRNAVFDKLELLPIATEEFDIITLLAVLEHLCNYEHMVAECYRGLRKGGRLIVTTPSPLSKPILEFLARLNIISRAEVFDHKQYFTKSQLIALLKKFNFSQIICKNFGLNFILHALR